jgi:two-component system response regulator YesN
MHKVVLVDDEKLIRQGLKAIVDWERYGFKVAGEAGNGREALLRYEELKPDLMVVDVRMPGMDGLHVIEKIRKTDAKCHFIILSGHAEFTYAQSAIAWGVNAYLLKPVDTEEIGRELTRIGTALQRESERSQMTEESTAERKERMLVSLLSGDGSAQPEEPLELRWHSYRVLLVKPHSPGADAEELIPAVKRKLEQLFGERGEGAAFAIPPYAGVLLRDLHQQKFDPAALYRQLEEALRETAALFAAAAGDSVASLADARFSYAQAAELLKNEFLFRGDKRIVTGQPVYRPAAAEDGEGCHPAPELNELADKLFYALDIGSRDALRRVLDEGLQSIAGCDGAEQAVKIVVAQWISLALTKLSKTGDIAYTAVQDSLPTVAGIYEQPDFLSLRRMLEEQLLRLLERLGTDGGTPPIKQILDFVERHYAENLKLETLGELFNYNSGYLGKMFKNHTGDSFHTYLDKVRIRNAKALLESGLKVRQAATRVGYANADYFHLKFKKYLGESPSLYKGKSLRK